MQNALVGRVSTVEAFAVRHSKLMNYLTPEAIVGTSAAPHSLAEPAVVVALRTVNSLARRHATGKSAPTSMENETRYSMKTTDPEMNAADTLEAAVVQQRRTTRWRYCEFMLLIVASY